MALFCLEEAMITIIENEEEWAEKYGIRPKEAFCPRCNIKITTDIPFAIKGYRGLKSADHGCGEIYTRKVMVPTNEEEIKYWADFARKM